MVRTPGDGARVNPMWHRYHIGPHLIFGQQVVSRGNTALIAARGAFQAGATSLSAFFSGRGAGTMGSRGAAVEPRMMIDGST
jgi:hypothetical protein